MMANYFGVDLSDLRKLENDLKNLSNIDKKKAVSDAVLNGAKMFKKEVVLRAPSKTDKLKKNIVADQIKSKKRGKVSAGVFINGDAWYWKFPEYGTSDQPPRPYVRTGFDVEESRVGSAVITEIITTIDKGFKK